MFKHEPLREKVISRVLIVTLILNFISAGIKIWAGESYGFFVLTTSGVESLFDGTSNILALVSIFYASKPADDKHQYGHNKYETVASLLIATLLLFSSFEMGKEVFHKFSQPATKVINFPLVPLICISISMLISLFATLYESHFGKKYNSPILIADAHHTFGDMIISVGVIISLILSYYGFTWVDIVAGSVICFYLIYLSLKILKTNIDELVDAAPFLLKTHIFEEALKFDSVKAIHEVRARGSSRHLYIDLHLLLQDDLPLNKAHDIGHEVEDFLIESLKKYAQVIDITIHIEPFMEHHEDH